MKKLILFIFIAVVELFAVDNNLTIKGFGTVGAVYNDNKDYIFRNDTLNKDGSAGDVDFFTDSILGLQVNYNFNKNISIISQLIAQEDNYGKKELKIDSAYLKYDSTDNIIFKAGRIRTPYFKNSDNRNIGYSKLMIREPIEVYGQVPFHSYNGVEFTYSNLIDKYFYTIQANYGKEHISIPIHSMNQTLDTKINDIKAINLTFGNEIAEIRATYMHGKTTARNSDLDLLFSTMKTLGLTNIANKYEYIDKDSEYLGFGLFINQNNFTFASEYGKRKVDSMYGNVHGYYATLGYNFNNITPYVSYSKAKMDETPITINTVVPSVNDSFNSLLALQNVAQDTKSIGLKYFINENLDFKLQYQRITPKGDFGSFFLSDTYSNSKLNVYSFVLNFIF